MSANIKKSIISLDVMPREVYDKFSKFGNLNLILLPLLSQRFYYLFLSRHVIPPKPPFLLKLSFSHQERGPCHITGIFEKRDAEKKH